MSEPPFTLPVVKLIGNTQLLRQNLKLVERGISPDAFRDQLGVPAFGPGLQPDLKFQASLR